MASLVDQIFRQAQLGTAQDPNANPGAEGMRIGVARKQVNLAEQRLQAELAQLPLQKTLLQQDAKKNELELTGQLQARQNYLDSSQAFTSLSAQVGEHLKSGRLNDAMRELALGGLSNNFLLNDPRYKALGDQLMQMQEAADKAEYQRQLAEARLGSAMDKPTAAIQNSEKLSMLKQAVEVAQAGNDPGAIAKAKRDLESFMEVTAPATETFYDPATGRPIFERGRRSDGLTLANQSKVQDRLASSLATIDVSNRLEPLISSDTVGVKAFVGSWINDRLLAQYFPGMVNDKRVTAEKLITELRSKAVMELGTPPISDRERAEILRSIPGINEPIDSPPRARQMLQDIKKMSAMRAIVASERLGEPVPKGAALVLSPADLEDMVKKGLITPKQAMAAFDAR